MVMFPRLKLHSSHNLWLDGQEICSLSSTISCPNACGTCITLNRHYGHTCCPQVVYILFLNEQTCCFTGIMANRHLAACCTCLRNIKPFRCLALILTGSLVRPWVGAAQSMLPNHPITPTAICSCEMESTGIANKFSLENLIQLLRT